VIQDGSPQGAQGLVSRRVNNAMHNKTYGPPSRRICLELCLAAAFGMTLAACGGGESTTSTPALSGPSAAALLGAQIFADTALSESGRRSCASCHVASFAFTADPTAGGPDALAFLCTLTDGFDPGKPESLV